MAEDSLRSKAMSEHPWIKSYPAGVHWDAELPAAAVPSILDAAVARWPEHNVLDFMGRKMRYRELDELANRAAKGLQALGVKPGVHVGLFMPNTPHYYIAFFGVLRAGGTVVNYSPLDAEKTLEHKIADSETDLMVTLDLAALYPQMGKMLGRTRLQKIIVGNLGEMAPAPAAVTAHLRSGGQLADVPVDERHLSFSALLDNDGRYQATEIADPRETIAVLQYTGGTTGEPKGAMLTHANLTVACHQIAATASGRPRVVEEGQERFLAVLPPFHIYALTVNMLLGLQIGAEMVLHARFDLDAAIKDLAAKRITVFPGVPTMYAAIVNHPEATKVDLKSLKFCASGGAPLPVELHRRFMELTGCNLVEGWGMTETAPTGTFTPVHGKRKASSCGIPHPGVELQIRSLEDPTHPVPLGEAGELCIRGPNVMKGYWKNPRATAAAFTADGFFRSGDVARMDEDGFVYIVDRTKDMILCGGFNVYPRLVEEAVIQHPAIAEVCVIGIDDPYRGQAPKAFVTLKRGATAPSLDELKEFLRDKLGKHEMLQALEVRTELPKTPVGKLSKKDLYAEEARKRAA